MEQQTEQPIRIAHIMGKMMGGGVESMVMNFYRHIDRSRLQFDFLVDSDSTLIPQEEIEQLGGRVIVIPPYQQAVSYHKALVSVFRRNRYLIVHSHINTLSVFPLFAAKRAKVPVRIAHSHSTAGKGEWVKNVMKYTLRPFSKVFATEYCACSAYAGKWLFGKSTMQKRRIHILNNGVAAENFRYNAKMRGVYRRQMEMDHLFVAGNIGRLSPQKNQLFLIDIFHALHKQCPDSLLLLVGEGELKLQLQKKAEQLGLQDSVWFLGQRADIAELLWAMDVFVFPSNYEGLGLVAIEAQAAGLQVIASDKVPQEAKVTDLVEFISLDKSAEQWAEKILQYRYGYPRRDTYDEIVSAGFSIEASTKQLEQVYKELLR